MPSALELQFLGQLKAARILDPETEHQFDVGRAWRFDFAWPSLLLAVEIHGGGWVGGRHHRPKGMNEDCLKVAEAQLQGWTVFTFTGDLVKGGQAVSIMKRCFDQIFKPEGKSDE